MTNTFIIGYTGHYENDTEVLHIVDNDEDLNYIISKFVDHKITDEEGARKHIRLSKRSGIYQLPDLRHVDREIFEAKYTELKLVQNATKNQIAYWKKFETARN